LLLHINKKAKTHKRVEEAEWLPNIAAHVHLISRETLNRSARQVSSLISSSNSNSSESQGEYPRATLI